MSDDDREFLTPDELASIMKVPKGTLASWRARGKGPPFVTFGERSPRYSAQEFKRWAASRTVTSSATGEAAAAKGDNR